VAEHVITLRDGVTLGDTVHSTVELRVPGAGDLRAAAREAEQVVTGPDGRVTLATSPSALHYAVLRRQIARLGDLDGPLALPILDRFSARDLERVQLAAELLDLAEGTAIQQIVEEAERRGRSGGAGRGAGAPAAARRTDHRVAAQ